MTLLIWTNVYFILWISPHISCYNFEEIGPTIKSKSGGNFGHFLTSNKFGYSYYPGLNLQKSKIRHKREIDELDVVSEFEIGRLSQPHEISMEVSSTAFQSVTPLGSLMPTIKFNHIVNKNARGNVSHVAAKDITVNESLTELKNPKPKQNVQSYIKDVEHVMTVSGRGFPPKGVLNHFEYPSVSSNFSDISFSSIHTKNFADEFEIFRLPNPVENSEKKSTEQHLIPKIPESTMTSGHPIGQKTSYHVTSSPKSGQNNKGNRLNIQLSAELLTRNPKEVHPEKIERNTISKKSKLISGKLNITIIFINVSKSSENNSRERQIYIPFGRRISTLFKPKNLQVNNLTINTGVNLNEDITNGNKSSAPMAIPDNKLKAPMNSRTKGKGTLISNLREKILKSSKIKVTSTPPSLPVLEIVNYSRDLQKQTAKNISTELIKVAKNTAFQGAKSYVKLNIHNSTNNSDIKDRHFNSEVEQISMRVTRPYVLSQRIQNRIETTIALNSVATTVNIVPITKSSSPSLIFLDRGKTENMMKMTKMSPAQFATQQTSRKEPRHIFPPTPAGGPSKNPTLTTGSTVPFSRRERSTTVSIISTTLPMFVIDTTEDSLTLGNSSLFYEPIRITTSVPPTTPFFSPNLDSTLIATSTKTTNRPPRARLIKETSAEGLGTTEPPTLTAPPLMGKLRALTTTTRPWLTVLDGKWSDKKPTLPETIASGVERLFSSEEKNKEKAPPSPKSESLHQAVKDVYFEPERNLQFSTSTLGTIPVPPVKSQKVSKKKKEEANNPYSTEATASRQKTATEAFETFTKQKTLLKNLKKESKSPNLGELYMTEKTTTASTSMTTRTRAWSQITMPPTKHFPDTPIHLSGRNGRTEFPRGARTIKNSSDISLSTMETTPNDLKPGVTLRLTAIKGQARIPTIRSVERKGSKSSAVSNLQITATSDNLQWTTLKPEKERETQDSKKPALEMEFQVIFFEPLRKISKVNATTRNLGNDNGGNATEITTIPSTENQSRKSSALKEGNRQLPTKKPSRVHSQVSAVMKDSDIISKRTVTSKGIDKVTGPTVARAVTMQNLRRKDKSPQIGSLKEKGKTFSSVQYVSSTIADKERNATSPESKISKSKRGRSRPLMINRLKPYTPLPILNSTSNASFNLSDKKISIEKTGTLQKSSRLQSIRDQGRNSLILNAGRDGQTMSNNSQTSAKNASSRKVSSLPSNAEETHESEEITSETNTKKTTKGAIRFPPRKAFEDFHYEPIKIRPLGR